MPFGTRSYWLQPWRSSLTTRPASDLENAIGINFNVTANEAPSTARLLGDSGFRRARLEIPWNAVSFSDPTKLANPSWWATEIQSLRDNGIRPLILLNANAGDPTPFQSLKLTLTQAASAGGTTVNLDRASAAKVVAGYTGLNFSWAAQDLITSVNSAGVATLSQPLPRALPAGASAATTLKYLPFSPPFLGDGTTPNPRFQATMAGWDQYVRTVCDFVRSNLGSDNFDVEVWNEMGFGSQFLDEKNYFSPLPDPTSTGSATTEILRQTVQLLHDPVNGLADVKVGDGFASQTPWVSGSTVPAGTDAIDKHPYRGSINVSPSYSFEPGIRPLDALGSPSYSTAGSGSATHYLDTFAPSYRVFMPEYYLTGIQTETLMRDLSPYQTSIYGVPHGATTHPSGGNPPATWITEDNLDQQNAMALGMPAADIPEMQAKAAMRFFVSYGSEGAKAVDLFAAKYKNGCCQILAQSFIDSIDSKPTVYPGDGAGGPTMDAVRRMVATLGSSQPISDPRQLSLSAIASDNNTDVQFTGDQTAAHPSLYNRNVMTFFPFQVSDNKFVAAVYVMSSDLTHYYTPNPAPGQTAYDMPPESFQLTISNVNGATANVSLYDPLTGSSEPASVVSRGQSSIVVQLDATDSVRMLTIDDSPATATSSATTSASRGTASSVVASPHLNSNKGKPATAAASAETSKLTSLGMSVPAQFSRTALRRGLPVTIVRGQKRRLQIVLRAMVGSRRSSVLATASVISGRLRRIVLRVSTVSRRRIVAGGLRRLLIEASISGRVLAQRIVNLV